MVDPAWPLWMTVRADEVRTLPQKEWGPWAEGRECVRGFPGQGHSVEHPHFFHCRKHMAELRLLYSPPPPHKNRDLGLCYRCKGPSEPDRKVVLLPTVACAEAEKRGTTVARISTRKFCAACDPYSKPFCRGRECNKAAKLGRRRRRIEPNCLCQPSRKVRHCLVCCKAAASHHRRVRAVRGKNRPPTTPVIDEVKPTPVELPPLADGAGQENCKGKLCEEAAKRGEPRHPVLPKGCCSQTNRHRPHCQRDHDRVREVKRAWYSAQHAAQS